MKTTGFLALFSALIAFTVAYPALEEQMMQRAAWLEELMTSIIDKGCDLVCEDTQYYINAYIPPELQSKLAKTGKDVGRAIMQYAFNN